MKRSLTTGLLSVALGMLANPTPVWADSASDIAAAKRLFSEAMVLEETGAWAQAADKLREAIAIKETPGLRYHLAHCEEQSGALVAASLDYARASELIREGAKAPDVQQLLSLANQRMAARVPKLTLVVPAGVDDLSVALDGNPVEPAHFQQSAPIDPGRHRITASARGRRDFATEIEIRTGESRTVEVLLELERTSPSVAAADRAPVTAVTSAPAPVHTEKASFGAREITLVAEGALTLAGLGVGIAYSVVRADAASDIDRLQHDIDHSSGGKQDACASSSSALLIPACGDMVFAVDRHKNATTLATVGFVGAGVGAAALALTWALWPASRKAASFAVTPSATGIDVRAAARF